MAKLARLWQVAATVVFVAIGFAGIVRAQQAPKLDQAAIERSWAVQAELARIEANKEAFVDEMLERWAPYVDPEKVDLLGAVKPVAMEATPWRLLGASLATDFDSAFAVLRGVVGPGWYVGAYVEGRAPSIGTGAVQAAAGIPDPGTLALGATTSSLVFNPIAPCRVADTRGTGVRTGILLGGSSNGRPIDLTSAFLTEGQGGQATACTGLPSTQQPAWAINVTATGYSEIGHLTIEPRGVGLSSSSFMNFSPSAYAIANAGTVTGAVAQLDSVYVWAFAPTHFIIDVTGYYSEAAGFAGGAVTSLYSLDTTVGANAFIAISSPVCPAGTTRISGGMSNTANGEILLSDTRPVFDYWIVWVKNTSGTTSYSAAANINCMDVK